MMSRSTKAERIAAATPIDQRALLTRRMACDYLSISATSFAMYEQYRDIVGIPIGSGKERRYRRRDLDDLIERMERQDTGLDRIKRGERA